MNTLFDKIDETNYRGVTQTQYNKAVLDYTDAMFKLFDSSRKYANGNLGLHLMWLGSWTSRYIARDVVDYSIEKKQPLNIALIEVLKLNCGGSGQADLDLMINILKNE